MHMRDREKKIDIAEYFKYISVFYIFQILQLYVSRNNVRCIFIIMNAIFKREIESFPSSVPAVSAIYRKEDSVCSNVATR